MRFYSIQKMDSMWCLVAGLGGGLAGERRDRGKGKEGENVMYRDRTRWFSTK